MTDYMTDYVKAMGELVTSTGISWSEAEKLLERMIALGHYIDSKPPEKEKVLWIPLCS